MKGSVEPCDWSDRDNQLWEVTTKCGYIAEIWDMGIEKE